MITILWVGFTALLLGMCLLARTTGARVGLVILACVVALTGIGVEISIANRLDAARPNPLTWQSPVRWGAENAPC